MNRESKFNFVAFVLFVLVFVATFLFLVAIKVSMPKITLYHYFNSEFFLLSVVFCTTSLLSRKYFFTAKSVPKRLVNNRIIIASIANLIILLSIKQFVYPEFYGEHFLIWFVVINAILDIFVLYCYYSVIRSRTNTYSYDEAEILREKMANKHKTVLQTKAEVVQRFVGEKMFEWLSQYADFEDHKSLVLATTQNVSLELLPHYRKYTIINLQKVNDIKRINKFFELLNEKLPDGGIFIGTAETIEYRWESTLKRFWFPFNYLALFADFFVNRMLPKINLTQDLYFTYTRGSNRALSRAEVLGRLYSCGFELIESAYVGHNFVFCVRKVKTPLYDLSPTYGPFVALRRIGKDKKEVLIYKLRTMYPYSEYIQKYVYESFGTQNGDKAEDDFRITGWGRFMRKVWFDELPMFINLFKGDVKLVGVRPLSRTKFDTYPPDLQDKRTRSKPGLVPPFYADMPQTQAELFASEERYLDAYFRAPLRTDVQYFFRAMYNIVIKRARSK
ncbi:MAG: sugar transferase [Prevotellaceae bacterium]|jgi:lipopolysaccharide/colanic/teichoic acid biosynthesis glycosyltransferase|nr:sugar transferase [Prevotellaceae bacterium]